MSVDGLPLKSIGGDDGNPAKAISSAPKPPEVDRSAVVPPTLQVSVSEVDINKMKPTTSAVLSDKIALSEGDHPVFTEHKKKRSKITKLLELKKKDKAVGP